MNTHDPTQRLRATLNPLRTSSLGVHHPVMNTPMSAASLAPLSALSSNQTPLSSIQRYNPQEWAPSPASQDHGRPRFPDMQPQLSPPPPPPYSPPRSQHRPISGVYDMSPPANISAVRAPLPPGQRPSPDSSTGQQSFAPPPNTSRVPSRERRFGLPSFGRRRETAEPMTVSPPAHLPLRPGPSNSPQPPSAVPHAVPANTSVVHSYPTLVPLQIPNNALATVPPGSRRAASTGAIGTPTSARSRSSSQVRWEPGMPLPPPPPGPPPSGSRSQSMNRTPSGPDPITSPPTRRPPPTGVAALGPVPPTPADWVDQDVVRPPIEEVVAEPPRGDHPANSASLEYSPSGNSPQEIVPAVASIPTTATSPSSLTRAGAMRSEKTLRERRTESRTRMSTRGSIDESSSRHHMSDIVIPSTTSIGSVMQRHLNKSTPKSGGALGSGRGSQYEGTPRTGDTATGESVSGTATPPFSPHPLKLRSAVTTPGLPSGSDPSIPHSLPTPPPQSRSASMCMTRPQLEAPVLISKEIAIRQDGRQFNRGTVERFCDFAKREEAAGSDVERVRLFAEFVVSESRIRRERYGAAIGAMGSEIFDLTRDLFRPMADRRQSMTSQGSTSGAGASSGTSAVAFTPQPSEPSGSNRTSVNSVFHEGLADKSPSTGGTGMNGVPMSPTGPPAGWQQSNYMPSLSPILSMSVSENHDGSSRGRPPSRWWESSSHGGDGPGRLERSKRESKYMGVDREAREALQWTDNPEPLSGNSVLGPIDDGGLGIGSSSSYEAYRRSDEYPPEKIPDPLHTPQAHILNALESASSATAPSTPGLAQLDVSRLVTLPPPYPRHHPALNNSHPELAAMRSAVRNLSTLTEVDGTKDRFRQESATVREESARAADEKRRTMRADLSQEIAAGRMGYADAAAVEAGAVEADKAEQKAMEKAEFERFQTAVVMPVNELLTGRIATATQLFDELCGRLFVETHEWDPNLTQEEGDEQPELLEKLTLLKWIFEARESLHKAVFDLLTDRNERYRDMVLMPYRQSGNGDKLAEAEAFFADDGVKRAQAYAVESLQRTEAFRDVVEANVVRGVEVQLSAFWDIAPPLGLVLEQIPGELRGFAVQVPAGEYEETPSYRAHPLQYLFTLLLHAEKSTHQFIESQTNLLCLLHGVKETVVAARVRVLEQSGGEAANGEGYAAAAAEKAQLTADLQDKVRVVRDQWKSGLGDSIVLVKERVGGWLLETGGWDETLEEGGVGSV